MFNKASPSTALNISESDIDVTDTFILIKSGGGNGASLSLDDVTVAITGENPWSGSLLEVIDTDDLGGGPGATTYNIPYGTYDEYLAAEGNGEGGVTTLSIRDSEIIGDVFNSVGSQTGSQTAFKNDRIDVSLENSELTGAVSSAYAAHCDAEGAMLTGTATVDSYGREGTYDYLTIGRVLSFAAPTVNNPVTLTLTGSVWNVSGLSYLSSLTLDDASTVKGDVYQDGQLVELEAGTYENVVVVPAGADLAAAESDAVSAIADAAAAGVVPADCSELVANTDLGSASGESASGEAS